MDLLEKLQAEAKAEKLKTSPKMLERILHERYYGETTPTRANG